MKNYILAVILACAAISIQAQTSSGIHHIKYLEINTANSDYSVDFVDEDKVVFATSTAKKIVNNKKFQAHLDLYEGEMTDEGQILNKSRNKGIQTKKIIKTGATFAEDDKVVYFSAKKYTKRKARKTVNSDLYKADINENGEWVNMVKLPFNTKNSTIENPTLSSDGTKLYFSSDLPGTLGGKDIFVVDVNENGTYSTPRNLGDKVNTVKDEITPFIADNNFLYYSSNGKENSLGNFDIYLSEAFENTVSESLHLDSPINSINDDFAYIVKSDKGYFSSNRLQGQDNNDIYSFYIEPDKPEECFQQVIGTVRDKETEKVLAGATIHVINEAGTQVDALTTDENGNYSYNLGCRDTFTFRAFKKDYSTEEHIINTANYTEAPSLEVNQSLTYNYKELKDNKIVINVNPIYFGFDKWNLNKNATIELDKIVQIMKEDTTLMIESGSHTDSRGTKSYNQILSERRSKAAVDYIISKGIDASRINAKGYGESKLLNNCADGVRCSIEDHKSNRRTEFVIMNKQASNYKRSSVDSVNNTSIVSSKEKPSENSALDDAVIDEVSIPEVEEISETQDTLEEAVENENSNNLKQASSFNEHNLKESSLTMNTSDINVPEGSILEKVEMIKNFKNDTSNTEEQVNEDLEVEVIYSTAITIVDNKELPDDDTINFEKNTLETNSSASLTKAKEPQVVEDIPDIKRTSLINEKEDLNNSIQEKKEEAFTNASSAFKSNVTSSSNYSKITDLSTSTKETNLPENEINSLKNNELISNGNNYLSQEASSITEKNSNMLNASSSLFEDEESEDGNMDHFSSDLSDKITVEDYDKNVSNKTEDASILIAKQQEEFKQEYSSNTKNLKKEEVLSINTIDVTPISINKKGKYLSTSNWKKVDVMRINFQINNNKYITSGYKEVFILIQNPSGTILNRKGRFKVNNGKELTFTEKTNAYYNNDQLNVSMVTDRFIQKIIKGIYTITIYIEGYPVGLEMVELT